MRNWLQARRMIILCIASFLVLISSIWPVHSENTPAIESQAELKKLSLEELLDIDVTSASRRPEPLQDVPSAIQIITQEEIHRSGATRIPEALRLASNLQVAQL